MLEEGLYNLTYAADSGAGRACGDALAVLRGGRILGSDRGGGVYTGSYDARAHEVRLRLDMPPNGELITGHRAGPEGASLDIVANMTVPAKAVVAVAGREIAVELTYLGPLPA